MYKFTFTNGRGQSIEIGNTPPFVLEEVEGIAGVGSETQLEKAPFQDGASYLDSLMDIREITIVAQIRANGDMESRRSEMLRIINPKTGLGKLTFENNGIKRVIDCVVSVAPVMPDNKSNRLRNWQRVQFQFMAPDPYFKDSEAMKFVLASFVGGFTIPFSFPISFGSVGQTLNLDVDSDVDTPILIRMNGELINPTIVNVTTGKFIRVVQTIPDGSTLEIDTAFGQKRVEIIDSLGNRTNAFHYLDPLSSLFVLEPGENTLTYTATSQGVNASADIAYFNRYMGV